MTDSVVIVGAGQTAAVAARTLRRRKFTGRITVVGDEKYVPYQRPPLSKEFLAGEQDEADTYVVDQSWYGDNEVDLRLGVRAHHLDSSTGDVMLDDGDRVRGDALLVATGCRARTLPRVQGERVVYLRDLDDAWRIRSNLREGARIVTVGAGFIGSEVASAARAAGADVVALEALATPLQSILGRQMAEVCARLQREHGVDLRTGDSVESVTESGGGVRVHTRAGGVVDGDLVVVGVGTVPNTQFAELSGMTVDRGVCVDEYCRTNLRNVYAAGDVTNHWHPLFDRRLRVEHFDNASKQGMTAVKNILGRRSVYDDPHWFWSDQFGLNLQYAGCANGSENVVVRGSVDGFDFIAFYLDHGVVKAAFSVERGGDMVMAKELIAARARPDARALADEDIELADLIAT